ncbi:hypothetical protein THAOC_22676 [Thalassiosira oceanica]|uniref:Uncharacterized protein n=1 Tax=Thalassiosira oceanica TaxID=159749 RepID=K0S8S9_THAOC|nr:hypothetical protein THAOC_22676 [Thalassiosira oceanica]|eukprot:EJK57296.1 hypothetical protein THAOC_22676 [Thalassiosira oceanica]
MRFQSNLICDRADRVYLGSLFGALCFGVLQYTHKVRAHVIHDRLETLIRDGGEDRRTRGSDVPLLFVVDPYEVARAELLYERARGGVEVEADGESLLLRLHIRDQVGGVVSGNLL